MNPNGKQSPNAGILMVLGGILYMAFGLVGMQHNQEFAAFFFGGRYFLGIPVSGADGIEALAVSVQSGFVFFLGAVVSVLGVILGLQALQAPSRTPTMPSQV
ncbi:MAG TPA: hypothetical protein VGS07_10435 [Thermoanaerobaculia bacterium]|jgi:hypothetical protein|nr:hypothetical protein [Thermoanaerobaculia bacterium]